jgi:hypothetical protein
MSETYYAAVYWRGRPEPLESYAQRAERLFRQLHSLDPILTRWFEQARSRDKALRSQFTPDLETLLKFFQKERYTGGAGDISFAAWNGESADNSVISFSCGSRSPDIIMDRCLLDLPSRGPATERVLREPILTQALRTMAAAWDPAWGVVTSNLHRGMVSESGRVGTFVGWIMYFAKSRGTIPPLPAPVRVESVEDKGTLVILTPERFTASNPEHVALAAQVQDILGQAGLLKPVKVLP